MRDARAEQPIWTILRRVAQSCKDSKTVIASEEAGVGCMCEDMVRF